MSKQFACKIWWFLPLGFRAFVWEIFLLVIEGIIEEFFAAS
jgi:hypothetical protein